MSPKSKRELAREHLDRALPHVQHGEVVEAITWLHLAAEATVVALAEAHGIAIERSHPSKARAATELHAQELLPTDLSSLMVLLNEARKETNYEGEDPDLRGRTLEEIAAEIEEAVVVAEGETGDS